MFMCNLNPNTISLIQKYSWKFRLQNFLQFVQVSMCYSHPHSHPHPQLQPHPPPGAFINIAFINTFAALYQHLTFYQYNISMV